MQRNVIQIKMKRRGAHKRYQHLSEEGKDKRQKKTRERYLNLTEKEKQKSITRIFLRNKKRS